MRSRRGDVYYTLGRGRRQRKPIHLNPQLNAHRVTPPADLAALVKERKKMEVGEIGGKCHGQLKLF